MWCHVNVDPLLWQLSIFLLNFLGFLHLLPLKSLCFSLLLCEGWIWLLLIRRSKLKNFLPQNGNLLLRLERVKQQKHSFLANWTDSALKFSLFRLTLGYLTDPLFLGSTAPFGRPSASSKKFLSFSHSVSLSPLLHLYLTLSKTQHQKAFSL